jgi:hypothetical protein
LNLIGIDLDDMIFPVPRESVKFSRLSKLTFSFALDYNELKKFDSEVFGNFM